MEKLQCVIAGLWLRGLFSLKSGSKDEARHFSVGLTLEI